MVSGRRPWSRSQAVKAESVVDQSGLGSGSTEGLLFHGQREADRRLHGLGLLRAERCDMLPQAGFGNGEDRIQVHDTRPGEAILKAEWDFGWDLPDTGRDGSDRHGVRLSY